MPCRVHAGSFELAGICHDSLRAVLLLADHSKSAFATEPVYAESSQTATQRCDVLADGT